MKKSKVKKTGSFGLTGGWGAMDTAGNGSPKNKSGVNKNFITEPDANKEMAPSLPKKDSVNSNSGLKGANN